MAESTDATNRHMDELRAMTQGSAAFAEAEPICNLEAEQVVIGACLLSDIGRAICMTELRADDFYAAGHAEIYRALGEADKSGSVQLVAVIDALKARGVSAVDRSYLETCIEQCREPNAPQWAAQLVKEKALRRRIIRTLGQAKVLAENQTRPLDEVQAATEAMVLGLREAPKDEIEPEDWAQQVIDEAAMVARGEDGRRRILTGMTDVDANVNLWPGRLSVLSGGTSQGKTAVAITMAANAALRLKQRTYFWSGEMDKQELWERMAASELSLSYEGVQKRWLTPEQGQAVKALARRIKQSPLIVKDQSRSVADIRAECRYIAQKQGPIDLVVVDYLTLLRELNMEADDQGRRDTRVGKAVWDLIQMARELDCHVLLLHQLNREKDRRSTGRPKISDLRESGQIEHHAYNVMLVYRPDRDEALPDEDRARYNGWLELIVGKARGGKVGSIFLGFDGDKQQVRDRPKPWPTRTPPAPIPTRSSQSNRHKGRISE